ncbi:MAG TPA: hypothetical protein VFX50_10450, partial [Gemmatimonadales bacterium]|nr:hypothetical protein [Gemmatimonadales bacterium]
CASSTTSEPMAHDPQRLRKTGRILSSLLQTSDGDLADFVRQRLDGADVDPARAADARAILISVADALLEPTPERMMSLEYTRRVLEEWKVGEEKPSEEAAAVAPVVVAAPAPPPVAPVVAPSPLVHGPPAANATMRSPWAPVAPSPATRAAPVVQVEPAAPAVVSPLVSPAVPAAPPPVVPPPVAAPVVIPSAQDPASSAPDPLGMTTAGAHVVPSSALPFVAGQAGTTPKQAPLEPNTTLGKTAPTGKRPPRATLPFKVQPDQRAPASVAPAPPVTPAPITPVPHIPSAPPVASAPPPLTVEQYAYFCTERALWPDHQADTCAKYGLSPAAEETLHEHFRTAFNGDTTLKTRFNEVRAEAHRRLGR